MNKEFSRISIKLFRIFIFIFFISSFLNACKKNEPDENQTVTLPSNLEVTISLDSNNFGFVGIRASANNANFYTFRFVENEIENIEQSNNGEASYTFKTAGVYTITIRAHALDDKYVEKVEIVEIISNVPVRIPGAPPVIGYSTPLSYPNYTLVWQDEFDGTALSSANWKYEIGTGSNGWGNSELQYYTDANTKVENGVLTIIAKKQIYNSSQYTSSRISSYGLQSFKYGRIDIRAALPFGQGIWPALWMLGDDFTNIGWPQCGEIDIMEMVGGESSERKGDNIAHGTVHWADANDSHAELSGYKKISNGILYDEYHVFSIIWDKDGITWYIDDQSFHSIDIRDGQFEEFRQSQFFIFNVAVGGKWPGNPNSTTTFPQQLHVDYVRVFQK